MTLTNASPQKTCHKRAKVLVDIKVEADLHVCRDWRDSPEQYAQDLERAIRSFERFLRDHRSQDVIGLDIQRIYKDLCSRCGAEWEPREDNGVTSCTSCGAVVERERQKPWIPDSIATMESL